MMKSVLVLLVLCHVTSAFPDGPPLTACTDMKPGTQVGDIDLEGHTALAQNVFPTYGNPRVPPYYIQIYPDVDEYLPGQAYAVSVVANQSAHSNFYRGILLQARSVECAVNSTIRVKEYTLGEFSLGSEMFQYMDCGDIEKSAISHKTPQWKINETVYWTAPDTRDHGDIVLRATIVRDATTYWTEVHSKILRRVAIQPPPRCRCSALYSSASLLAAALLALLL